MDTPTIEQLASKVESMQGEIDSLKAAISYAVHGIGDAPADPREVKSE